MSKTTASDCIVGPEQIGPVLTSARPLPAGSFPVESRPLEVESRPLTSGANPWPALGRWMVGEDRDAGIFDPEKTGKR